MELQTVSRGAGEERERTTLFEQKDSLLVLESNAVEINVNPTQETSQETTSRMGAEDDQKYDIPDPLSISDTFCSRWISATVDLFRAFWSKYARPVSKGFLCVLLLLYTAYFIYACYRDLHAATGLVVMTSIFVILKSYALIKKRFGANINLYICLPLSQCNKRIWKYTRWVIFIGLPVSLTLFLVLDTGRNPSNLRSAGALAFFILTLFVTSKDPAKVKWRPVITGLLLQFIMGLIILRWSYGYQAFKFLADQVTIFAGYTDEGSKVVFGDPHYLLHPVAFKILPVIVYFSCVIRILHYLGISQWIITKLGWFLQVTMGTTPIESLHSAASIFLGQIECTILFRPFIPKLTLSELNAMMTAGFATIAGTVVAAYIEFGAPGEHVIASTIMSAPVALAIAKIQVPETEKSMTATEEEVNLGKSEERNLIEAACTGASSSIKLVAVVAVNFLAFLALLAFVDATLSYLGGLVGFPQLSFQFICSYVFMPLAYVIGVDWEDAGTVGGLIGTKIFFSEFLAFQQLQPYIENNSMATRSKDIATYLLAGFGSIASTGIYMGALIAIVPEKREAIAKIGLRAMIGGNIACFMTASICGLLYEGSQISLISTENVTSALYPSTTFNTIT